jgi:hypothetical protein
MSGGASDSSRVTVNSKWGPKLVSSHQIHNGDVHDDTPRPWKNVLNVTRQYTPAQAPAGLTLFAKLDNPPYGLKSFIVAGGRFSETRSSKRVPVKLGPQQHRYIRRKGGGNPRKIRQEQVGYT